MKSEILNKNSSNFRATSKIEISGSSNDVLASEKVLKSIEGITVMAEPEARLAIQQKIDSHGLAATIMFDGSHVWSKKKIVANLDRIIQTRTLWDTVNGNRPTPNMVTIGPLNIPSENFKPILSKYFYDFLVLKCGSIAHFNLHGWVVEYPTLDHLKAFFKKNEYDMPVMAYLQQFGARHNDDAIEVVKAIEMRLYPFRAYVAAGQASASAPLAVKIKN